MAYVDTQTPKDRAAGIAGVVPVHAAMGGLLVAGLTVTGVIAEPDPPFTANNVEVKLPPPPPTPPEPRTDARTPQAPDIFVPMPRLDLRTDTPDVTTADRPAPTDTLVYEPLPRGPVVVLPSPVPLPSLRAIPTPTPTFDPIPVRVANDPGSWISTADYRPSWVRRDWAGRVGFALSLDANGKVRDCRVTTSSGHAQMDEATCRLIRQRARFTAARDSSGAKVAGDYRNSVVWRVPE